MEIKIRKEFETQAEALAFKAKYLSDYSPMAYDTSLRMEEVDGKWVVRGYRFGSGE